MILYRKLFINVLHLQQSAQVINYFKSLPISNDWFLPWYTPYCWFFVALRHIVVHPCWNIFLYTDAINDAMKHTTFKSLSETFSTVEENVFLTAGSFIKSDVTLSFDYINIKPGYMSCSNQFLLTNENAKINIWSKNVLSISTQIDWPRLYNICRVSSTWFMWCHSCTALANKDYFL